jgi:diguanylate cyclase (GGDEF)-like protein
MVLPETGLEEAAALAERIRAAISEVPHRVEGGEPFHTSCSIGVAKKGDGRTSVEDLLKRADEALYEAKRLGRNRVVCGSGRRE